MPSEKRLNEVDCPEVQHQGPSSCRALARRHPDTGLTDLVPVTAAGAAVPLGRLTEPEKTASAAVFLASDASSFVNGAELVVDGWRRPDPAHDHSVPTEPSTGYPPDSGVRVVHQALRVVLRNRNPAD